MSFKPFVADVRQYGAKGDSATDDLAAFEAARDALEAAGGGTLYVPGLAGGDYYLLSAPVQLSKNIRVLGEGSASYIRNESAQNNLAGNIFHVGHYNPNRHTDGTIDYYDLDAASEGDFTITLTTAGDADNFTVGDVIQVVSSVAAKPDYNTFHRVTAINAGVLSLDHPIHEDIAAGSAAPFPGASVSPIGIVPYVGDRISIENLRLYSDDGFWLSQNASYECTFRDLIIEKSRGLAYGNAYTHCTFDNVRGAFAFRAVELADGCFNTRVRNLGAMYIEDGIADASTPILAIHVQSKACSVDGATVMGWGHPGNRLAILGGNANAIRNVVAWSDALLSTVSHEDGDDHEWENILHYAPSGLTNILNLASAAGGSGLRLRRVRTIGPTSNNGLHVTAATDVEVVECENEGPAVLGDDAPTVDAIRLHNSKFSSLGNATSEARWRLQTVRGNVFSGGEDNNPTPDAELSSAVLKALFDAHTILAATDDDTPAALTVAEQTLVGRITGGNIAALSQAQIRTLIGNAAAATRGLVLEAGAVTDLDQVISDPPTQAEVQAISDKGDELLASLRAAGVLAT